MRRTWLRWLAAAAGVTVFALLLRSADPAKIWGPVQSSGPWLLLALLPFLGTVTADSCGFSLLLRRLGHRVPLLDLIQVRLALEAFLLTLPGGSFVAETSGPALFASRCDIPVRDGVVVAAARRWMTLRAHAIYMLAGALIGFGSLQAASQRVLGRPGLGVFALLFALWPLSVSIFLEVTLSRGVAALALQRWLARLPGRAGLWFERRKQSFATVDEELRRFKGGRRAALPATSSYLAGWFLESVETFVILRLIGAEVSFAGVLAVEPALSMVRSLAFFVPAGLGAQDLGYLALFGATPHAFAFVAVKRAKELVWAAIGWTLFVAAPSRRRDLAFD